LVHVHECVFSCWQRTSIIFGTWLGPTTWALAPATTASTCEFFSASFPLFSAPVCYYCYYYFEALRRGKEKSIASRGENAISVPRSVCFRGTNKFYSLYLLVNSLGHPN
jgi:hypothetical protein